MKTNNYKYLIGFFLIVLSISCSKDWLEIEQKGAIPQEEFFTTDDECLSAVAAVYDMIQVLNAQDWSSLYHMKTVLCDEANAGGKDEEDQPEYHQLDDYTHTPSNTKINDIWQRMYYAVYRANVVITKVEPDTPAKTIIVAEAKALRAYLYFELVNLFGDVPLVLAPQTPDEYLIEKSSVANIYSQIEIDLADAIADLPYKKDRDAADAWRVGKGFAQAMLGKALVFQEKYSAALAPLNAVIQDGGFGLVDDFARIHRSENEYGIESLFEIGYVTTEGHNWSNYGYWGQGRKQEQNIHWVLCGPREKYFKGGTTGIFEGWGAAPPKDTIYKQFNADDPRRGFTLLTEDELIAAGGDLRSDPTVPGELPHENEGYTRLKYTTFIDETSMENGDVGALNLGTNLRIMRYAEVLLLAAEAHLGNNGDGAAAATEINKVRARSSVDYTRLTTASWEDLKYERTVELCFEGHRFYDLVRWGDALKELGYEGFQAKHAKLPIPQPELDANPKLVQNTPWQ